jgi:hypothetical protein
MNSLETLRYYLAGSGRTPEEIERIEQFILLYPGIDVYCFLSVLRAYEPLPSLPVPQPTTKKQKTPYYQKDKAKWWK